MKAVTTSQPSWTEAHRQFDAALDRMNSSFRFAFRRRRPQDRIEAIAEACACAWKAWYGLVKRGKDPLAVGVIGIAGYAIRHANKGRRIGNRGGGRGAMDVYHPRAQRAGGFRVLSDPDAGRADASRGAGWRETIAAHGRSTPAEQAIFRLDFEAWLGLLPDRKRRMAELLAQGHGTGTVAELLGVSAAAVSQTRPWLADSWRRFQDETPEVPGPSSHPSRRMGAIPT